MEGSYLLANLKPEFASVSTSVSSLFRPSSPSLKDVQAQSTYGFVSSGSVPSQSKVQVQFPEPSRRLSGQGCSCSRHPDRASDGLSLGPRLVRPFSAVVQAGDLIYSLCKVYRIVYETPLGGFESRKHALSCQRLCGFLISLSKIPRCSNSYACGGCANFRGIMSGGASPAA